MPTLVEFVHRAKQLGFKLRTIELLSPDGRERMRYLWRNPQSFAELPNVRHSDRLTRSEVERLCARLRRGIDGAHRGTMAQFPFHGGTPPSLPTGRAPAGGTPEAVAG